LTVGQPTSKSGDNYGLLTAVDAARPPQTNDSAVDNGLGVDMDSGQVIITVRLDTRTNR